MVNKIIHKHSSVITDGHPKIPTENQLEYGELAINYGKGVETISFKNTNNEIVEIKTKNYFDEKILLNSKDINTLEDKVNDIKSTIEGNELVTAAALSDLDDKINSIGNDLRNKSDIGHTHVSSAITDSISSMTDITETASGLVQGKAVYELINDTEEQIAETLLEHDTRINNILVEIENNELVTATAISDLDVRTNDIKLNVENNELITAAAITEINGRINTIQGNDKNTSMRNIASQEIAKVVAEAPDNLNTLKEIADWIANDTTGSIQMSNDIIELKEIVSGYTSKNKIKTDIDSKSDKTHTHDYLPLSGGTMSNDIDMNLHSIIKTGVDIVESLPTENLFNGRQVTYEGKLYTYNNNEWNCIADDLGGKPETHEENFVYQPTASDLSIKDGFADIKKLKGNTIVWNQKVADYNTYNSRYMISDVSVEYNNGTFILRGSGSSITFRYKAKSARPQRKLFIKFEAKTSESIRYSNIHINPVTNQIIGSGEDTGYISTNAENYSTFKKIYTTITFNSDYGDLIRGYGFGIYIPNYTGSDVYIKNIQIFDLTQMFGEGNEPTTVEEFEAMFPNEYYEYNEGELMSFDGKGVKSVGFNQWDEEWELGNGNNGDIDYSNKSYVVSKNYIKVIPNATYYIKAPRNLYLYGYNANKIKTSNSSLAVLNGLFTIPNNIHYLKFQVHSSYSKQYNNDICINLSHSGYRNGEYEPYEDYKLSFQDGKTISQLMGKLNGEGDSVVIFPDGLRSAGEAYDEITYDEDTGKHKAIKRIGSVDMGTLAWGFYNNIYAKIDDAKNDAFFICSKYECLVGPDSMAFNDRDKVLWRSSAASGSRFEIYVRDSAYADVDTFKTAMSGVILYYELKTPEVYELDFPINTSYEAYDFGTEEVLYNDDKEVNIPMKANIEYGFNAVDMIRGNYFEVDKIKKGLNEINFLITDLDVRTNDIKSNIESNELVTAAALSDLDVRTNDIKLNVENNELVTASAITNLEERIKELEKKINQLLSNN